LVLQPHPQPTTSPKPPNYEHTLIDPTSFGTYIQSLFPKISQPPYPVHRILKAARPSFASGLSKLINKAISSNSLLDWHRLVSPCFPLSVLSSGPRSQGAENVTSSTLQNKFFEIRAQVLIKQNIFWGV